MSHDPKYDYAEFTPAVIECDECAEPIDETDLAPSCGAHRLHLGACRDWFSCRHCDIEWEEATSE